MSIDTCPECGEEIDLDAAEDRICDRCGAEICVHCAKDRGGETLCPECVEEEDD